MGKQMHFNLYDAILPNPEKEMESWLKDHEIGDNATAWKAYAHSISTYGGKKITLRTLHEFPEHWWNKIGVEAGMNTKTIVKFIGVLKEDSKGNDFIHKEMKIKLKDFLHEMELEEETNMDMEYMVRSKGERLGVQQAVMPVETTTKLIFELDQAKDAGIFALPYLPYDIPDQAL
jgi:hypothetical protein